MERSSSYYSDIEQPLRILESTETITELDPASLTIAVKTLETLISDAINVSPMNFPLLVDLLVIFNNVMRHGKVKVLENDNLFKDKNKRNKSNEKRESEPTFDHLTISLTLVDSMASLHQKAAPLYKSTNAKYAVELEDGEKLEDRLWIECWEPLLYGISRACCDCRKQVSYFLRCH